MQRHSAERADKSFIIMGGVDASENVKHYQWQYQKSHQGSKQVNNRTRCSNDPEPLIRGLGLYYEVY